MKTSELTGANLDYWVARALGYQTDITKIKPGGDWCAIELRQTASCASPDHDVEPEDKVCAIAMVPNAVREFPPCILGQKIGRGKTPYRSSWFYPSTLWDHGGPIIDREIAFLTRHGPTQWSAVANGSVSGSGPTPLIAAMRAYVASRFGDEVDDENWQACAPGRG